MGQFSARNCSTDKLTLATHFVSAVLASGLTVHERFAIKREPKNGIPFSPSRSKPGRRSLS